ncbi:MAG TPA: hypothetical protein VFG51_03430 [Candidatus Saccharimonadia bacterium]|nr:hypothetical protein [Candidatus Saccharimonadia bacterium]
MKIKNKSWALAYSLFEIVQGLLIHPYQTMRQLVREKVFAWMVFAPVFLWIASVVVWKILEDLFFFAIPFPGFWLFIALWFTIGIALYQILLLYFLLRFSRN